MQNKKKTQQSLDVKMERPDIFKIGSSLPEFIFFAGNYFLKK